MIMLQLLNGVVPKFKVYCKTWQNQVWLYLWYWNSLNYTALNHSCFFFIHLDFVFRCKLLSYPNDTYEVQSEYHQHLINLTIPRSDDETLDYDRCYMYVTTGAGNSTKEKCNEWVYETTVFESTFTSKVNSP
jgi:hypothetical protein